MKEIFFSIIIPVYNCEKYISRCIDSILSQTYNNFSIILIDDGSTDNSPAICDSYTLKDKRISVIHKKNMGVSNARNDGIRKAEGDWILFCDSDDWFEKETLSIANKNLLNNDFDILQFGFQYVYTDKIIKISPVVDKDVNLSELHFCTMVLNKSFLLKNNIFFPENISFAEDWYFKFLIYSYDPKIIYDSYISYNYFYNNSSVVNNISKKNIMDHIFILKEAEHIKSPYNKTLEFQKKLAKEKILFTLKDVKLWKKTFPELNIKHIFWLGPKHVLKSIIYIIGIGNIYEKFKN